MVWIPGENHTNAECATLKSSNLTTLNLLNNPQIIMPLRCLLIRNYDQPLWDQLNSMEAHLVRRKGTPIWNRHQEYIVEVLSSFVDWRIHLEWIQYPFQVLKDLNQLNQEDLSNDLVQKLCGILDVNSFEVRPKGAEGNLMDSQCCLRGLYLKASLLTHDCIGNTLVSVDDDFVMTVHASKPISSGEIIFFNYSNCLKVLLKFTAKNSFYWNTFLHLRVLMREDNTYAKVNTSIVAVVDVQILLNWVPISVRLNAVNARLDSLYLPQTMSIRHLGSVWIVVLSSRVSWLNLLSIEFEIRWILGVSKVRTELKPTYTFTTSQIRLIYMKVKSYSRN